MPSKKVTKEQQKATAKLSRERLKRITKTRRHHIRTNVRVLKYGAKSFVRNTWLSVAAIAIMAVTLIVLAATNIATSALSGAIDKLEQRIDMSVYVKQGATQDQIDRIVGRMQQLPTVLSVTSTSPEEANKIAIERILSSNSKLTPDKKETMRQNLLEAPNTLPWTLNIQLVNLDNTRELEDFVQNDESIKDLRDEEKEPSYASGQRETIDRFSTVMDRIELIGLIAAGIFALIAILVVFNTIRMAIYNRKEEIYMMQLVGASRWFIVGPFVVEAAFYGIIAGAIASAFSYVGVYLLRPHLNTMLEPTINIMEKYWFFVIGLLILTGIVIGVVSSLLATRKYLRHNR